MALSVPVPDEVTLTWNNLTPDVGENILKILHSNDLSQVFMWPEANPQPLWEFDLISWEKTKNKRGKEIYNITATICSN